MRCFSNQGNGGFGSNCFAKKYLWKERSCFILWWFFIAKNQMLRVGKARAWVEEKGLGSMQRVGSSHGDVFVFYLLFVSIIEGKLLGRRKRDYLKSRTCDLIEFSPSFKAPRDDVGFGSTVAGFIIPWGN